MFAAKLTGPLLLGLLLVSGCASFNASRQDKIYQEVLYLTTREDTGKSDPGERFAGERGKTRYGAAMVAIDPEPVLSAFSVAQTNRLMQRPQLPRRQALQKIQPLQKDAFMEAIGRYSMDREVPEDILIFIHGYKRSFADSVENAARLRYQLAFPGPAIAFSWPSTDSVSGYLADVENLDWSVPALRDLIEGMGERFPHTRLHLVAHSLGNRALLQLLAELLQNDQEADRLPIGQLVLIAPDFDRDIFMRDVAPELHRLPFRKTLYVSSEDFPLMASGKVFQYPRLGDSRELPPIIKGVETIDVSDAINVFNGHGYYEANRATIEDLYFLIRENKPAHERPGLIQVETDEGPYWRLQPVM
ncbi:alpha/beta fold hydrolase [Puniceicoccales bacterium CK1056]|uniref:Alpha/beta fold hydrolase n=1 Tax=Oceanipulchritudo coccoides TaxID=2706888 RepID=A0A6B2LWV6_9BACT|nr:alpha/beta fold hydrolase [Oceanipulchritudo coccoides]NDV60988.1 alpha/beta fold hydrolase [Oceanipulchritudo coccoides]